MKTAVVATYNYNYGSVLQTYALQYTLKKQDIDSEIICYSKKQSIKQILRVFNGALLKAKIASARKDLLMNKSNTLKNYLVQKKERFRQFLLENCIFSKPVCGMTELKKIITEYNAVILGSDQVWNPINIGTDYFNLLFVPDYMKKCTYASSFGVSTIPKYQTRKTKRYLSRINKISVREKQGKYIVEKLFGKEALVVLDPTLLLTASEWETSILSKNCYNKKYLLAYFVGTSKEHRQIAERICDNLSIDLVLLPHIDEYIKDDRKYETELSMTAGPEEFVDLIRGAEWIVTDSFHATAFSLINHKKFCALNRFSDRSKRSMNSRIDNLLSIVKLNERRIDSFEEWCAIKNSSICYQSVDSILEKEREKSLQYIDEIRRYIYE